MLHKCYFQKRFNGYWIKDYISMLLIFSGDNQLSSFHTNQSLPGQSLSQSSQRLPMQLHSQQHPAAPLQQFHPSLQLPSHHQFQLQRPPQPLLQSPHLMQQATAGQLNPDQTMASFQQVSQIQHLSHQGLAFNASHSSLGQSLSHSNLGQPLSHTGLGHPGMGHSGMGQTVLDHPHIVETTATHLLVDSLHPVIVSTQSDTLNSLFSVPPPSLPVSTGHLLSLNGTMTVPESATSRQHDSQGTRGTVTGMNDTNVTQDVMSQVMLPNHQQIVLPNGQHLVVPNHQQRLSVMPTQQPAFLAHQSMQPGVQQGILISQQQILLTIQQMGTLSNQQQSVAILSNQQQGLLSNQQQGLLPNQQQGLLPNQQQGLLPNQQQGLLPNQQQGLLPNQQQGLLPNQQQGLLPNQQQGLLHNQQQGLLPNQQQELLPNQHNILMPSSERLNLVISCENQNGSPLQGALPQLVNLSLPPPQVTPSQQSLVSLQQPASAVPQTIAAQQAVSAAQLPGVAGPLIPPISLNAGLNATAAPQLLQARLQQRQPGGHQTSAVGVADQKSSVGNACEEKERQKFVMQMKQIGSSTHQSGVTPGHDGKTGSVAGELKILMISTF